MKLCDLVCFFFALRIYIRSVRITCVYIQINEPICKCICKELRFKKREDKNILTVCTTTYNREEKEEEAVVVVEEEEEEEAAKRII